MSEMVERLSQLRDELSKFTNLSQEAGYEMKNDWVERARLLIEAALDTSKSTDDFVGRLNGISFNAPFFAIDSYCDEPSEAVSNEAFKSGIVQCRMLMDDCIDERIRLERVFSSK